MASVVNERAALRPTLYKSNGAAINLTRNGFALKRLVAMMFSLNANGVVFDPNDLTAEKINWRKNLLLNTEDFKALSASGFSAVKAVDGWALTASLTNTAGWALGALYPIGSVSANVGTGTIVRSIEFKKGTANEVRLGGASDTGAIFIDLNTLLATRNAGNLPYVITPLSDGWYRLEMWHYTPSFATTHLSHMFGWGMTRTSSGFDAAGQVGSTIYARKPSFAFVPYESTAPVPYQPISDFNSDFLRQFPLHTLYQDAAGTTPVTAAGQPVGLVLDKSKGLVLGDEKSQYADGFASLTGINPVGVTMTLAGRALVATAQSGIARRAEIPVGGLTVGKFYKISFKAYKSSFGIGQHFELFTAFTKTGYVTGVTSTVSTEYSFILEATAVYGVLRAYAANTEDIGAQVIVESVSVKEITGNHASQTVSASRPILQQSAIFTPEKLGDPEFNDPSYWTLTGSGWTIANGLATASAATGGISKPALLKANTLYEFTIKVNRVSGSLNLPYDGQGANIQSVSQSGTFTRIFLTTTTAFFACYGNNFTGTVESISVKELTGYRTDQNYLDFDGFDDFLQTRAIDLSATNKLSVFAAVKKRVDGAYGTIVEQGANTDTDGSFVLTTSSGAGYYVQNGSIGNRSFITTTGGASAPRSDVVAVSLDRSNADATEMRYSIESTELISTEVAVEGASAASGNFGNAPLFIGRRNGTSLPFNGRLYGLIIGGVLTPNEEVKAIKREMAKTIGV